MQRFKVTEPVFDTTIHFVFGTVAEGDRVATKVLGKQKPEDLGLVRGGLTRWKEDVEDIPNAVFIVYINEDADKTELQRVIIHEVSHVVDLVFKRHAIDPGWEATELRSRMTAYFSVYAMERVCP